MEDPKERGVFRARHRKQVRARAHDADTPVDEKLSSRQRYGLPIQRRIEINCVAVIYDSQRLTQ